MSDDYYYVEVRMKDGEVHRATALGNYAAWVCRYCRHQMLAVLDPDPACRPTRNQHCCEVVYLLHGDPQSPDRIGRVEEL